jgi:hypothetical protein
VNLRDASRPRAWVVTVVFAALAAAGCGSGGSDGDEAAPPSVRGVCKAPGTHYLGKPVPGRATVCFTLIRSGRAIREIGIGLEVAAAHCGLGHTDHWHADFSAAGARQLGPGGRIDVSIAFPVDDPRYEPLETVIRGSVRGAIASGTVADARSCYPRFRWTAHRVGSD